MSHPITERTEIDRLQRWETAVDQAIREAQQRGDFDNLPGHGQPLRLDDNPFAGDRALGFTILNNAGILPEWMELEKEITADRAALATLLERSTQRLATAQTPPTEKPPERHHDRPVSRTRRLLLRLFPQPHLPAPSRLPTAPARTSAYLHARQTYLDRAAQLDVKIVCYNTALPNDLRWREQPRLTPDAAAREFDAAVPDTR